jgi:hypothetical protein
MKSLSVRKNRIIIFIALLLYGCAVQTPDEEARLAALVQEGTLAAIGTEDTQAGNHRLAQAVRGDMVFPWQAAVNVIFPNTYTLSFEMGGRPWREGNIRHNITASAGDEIKKDTFIAEIFFNDNTLFEIYKRELDHARKAIEQAYANERNHRLNEIAVLRYELEIADDWESTAILLARRELEYTLFIRESEDRRIAFNEQSEALEAYWQGERLYAPADGIITFVTPAADGTPLRDAPRERGIMVITDDNTVYFTVQGGRSVYRYGEEYLVQSIPAGGPSFFVRLTGDPLIFPVSRDGVQDFIFIPADAEGFRGELALHGLRPWDLHDIHLYIDAPALMAVNTVIIPEAAVHAEGVRTFVYVYDEGILRRRYVNTGTAFGGNIQILTGLEEGQWVVLP